MRGIARFRIEVTRARIQYCNEVRLELKRGESLVNLCRSQNFVRQIVLTRATQRARHDHSARRSNHEAASDLYQGFSATLLQLTPKVVGSLDQGDIERMLEVRLPDDATVAVRGAERVSLVILLQPENAQAAAREVKKRCAPHCAESDYNGVIAVGPIHNSCGFIRLMETSARSQRKYAMENGDNFLPRSPWILTSQTLP